MEDYNIFVITRALHVIGVVFWIGGVAFVTTVLIPSLKNNADHYNRWELFEQLEGRFGKQAKLATLLTGISGYYMLDLMGAWGRYLQLQYWWVHLMTFIWVIFTLVLFVLEPWFLHSWFKKQANKDSDQAFSLLHRFHIILLTLSLLAVAGAVGGSHGYMF